jgi:hypothetical protein
MVTILVLNALSSLTGAVAIGVMAMRYRRNQNRKILVQPLYATTHGAPPGSRSSPHDRRTGESDW